MRRYGLVLLLIIVVLAAGITATTAQQAQNKGPESCIDAFSAQQWESARLTGEVRLAEEDTVQITYDGHGELSPFEIDPPAAATVVNTTGFSKTADGTYSFDGQQAAPTLTYRVRTGLSINDSYASGESWLHTPLPSYIQTRVHHTTPGGGHVGTRFAYLGNYSAITLQNRCHEVTAIIAAESRSAVNGEQIEQQLQYAMTEYDVGHRYSKTTVFVTPGKVDPTSSGEAHEADAWASSRHGSLTTTRIVLHEYLHTRHSFGDASLGEMSWFNEGTTEYMSLRLMLGAGTLSPREYNKRLETSAGSHGVLSNRSTWTDHRVPYERGMLFNAYLDKRIRKATDGKSTLEDVVALANAKQGNQFLPSERTVFDIVANVSNTDTAEWANSTVDSSRAFGISPIQQKTSPGWEFRLSIAQENLGEQPLLGVFFGFMLGVLLMEISREVDSEPEDNSTEESENG
ncbi:hypothetical protein [Halorubrum sp. T3]|uniref:hypothetical protein n=1 Tax=Halorubrum sp. T3 TaxID=1194088 RepID=UPI0012BA679B|nr:hypothetical protein [Halorubrum sp. T3]